MKKVVLLVLVLTLALSLAACGAGPEVPEPNVTPTPSTPSPEPTPSPTPEPTALAVGTKATLGDWNITVTGFELMDSIAGDYYGSFVPSEGNQFAVVSVTIYNAGKSSGTFLPSYSFGDDVRAKIIYGDGYEFSATSLLAYDADLHDEYVNPLSSASGIIAFELPMTVVENSTEPLYILFSAGNAEIEYQLR